VAYNQPPHLGYYLRDYVEGKIDLKPTGITQTTAAPTAKRVYDLQGRERRTTTRGLNIIREGNKVIKAIVK
jgi:rhamnogalacturonan endolyase